MNKEEKSARSRRLNLLDFLIIIAVIALISGGLYAYSKYTAGLNKNKQQIEYQVELKGVDQSFIDAIKIGDPLRESVKGNNLGNVAEKTTVAASNINTDFLNGKYVAVPVPDKQDVTIKISSMAEVSERSITVGGLKIKIGQKLFVKGKGYAKEGFIINIDIKE